MLANGSEALAAVLTRDVSIASFPEGTPLRLKKLVRDCLIRDWKQRPRDVGHARIEIARIEAGAAVTSTPVTMVTVPVCEGSGGRVLPER